MLANGEQRGRKHAGASLQPDGFEYVESPRLGAEAPSSSIKIEKRLTFEPSAHVDAAKPFQQLQHKDVAAWGDDASSPSTIMGGSQNVSGLEDEPSIESAANVGASKGWRNGSASSDREEGSSILAKRKSSRKDLVIEIDSDGAETPSPVRDFKGTPFPRGADLSETPPEGLCDAEAEEIDGMATGMSLSVGGGWRQQLGDGQLASDEEEEEEAANGKPFWFQDPELNSKRSPQLEESTRKRIRQDIARLILRANRARRRALSTCYREGEEAFEHVGATVPKDSLMPRDQTHARREFEVPSRQAWAEDGEEGWRGEDGGRGWRGEDGIGGRRGRSRDQTDYSQLLQRAADVTTYAQKVLSEQVEYEKVAVCIPIPSSDSPVGSRHDGVGFGASAPRFIEGRITNNDYFLFGPQKWESRSSNSEFSPGRTKYAWLMYDKMRPSLEQDRLLRMPRAGASTSLGRREKRSESRWKTRRHRGELSNDQWMDILT